MLALVLFDVEIKYVCMLLLEVKLGPINLVLVIELASRFGACTVGEYIYSYDCYLLYVYIFNYIPSPF